MDWVRTIVHQQTKESHNTKAFQNERATTAGNPSSSGNNQAPIPDIQENQAIKCFVCGLSSSQTSFEMGIWECDLLRLKAASENGCPRCSVMTELITLFAPDSFQGGNKIKAFNDFVVSASFSSGIRAREETYLLEIFRLSESSKTPFENALVRTLPSFNTASEQTISAIQKWSLECRTHHSKCASRTSFRVDQLPSRILDLRFGNVRLRDDLVGEYSYACLSHCWGTKTTVAKTTTETIEQFKKSIPWHVLTKTFHHAIDVCRRLSIDFLWIDSLCIKQDDAEDWKNEAMRMADIYENAYLTIAGTKSKDGSEGLYSKVNEEFSVFHLVSRNLYLRQRPPPFPRNWTETDELDSLPLLKRGWIYQERRLSRRMVHFCAQEVVWECITGRRSESGCNDEDFETDASERDTVFEREVAFGFKRPPPTMEQWHETVSEYSGLSLTFDKDRLAALSGVAQRMGSLRIDDRYVAGLWEKTLLHDLEWSPRKGMKLGPKGRSLNFSAPTWSWASVKTSVSWVRLHAGTPDAEVVEISCPPAYIGHDHSSSDPSPKPCLTLRGRLIPVELTRSVRPYFKIGSVFKGDRTEDVLKWDIEFGIEHSSLRDFYSSILVLPDYLFHESGPYHLEPDIEVFLLPFLVRYRKGRQSALLLRQQKYTPFFERIGLVFLNQKVRSAERPIIIYGNGMTSEFVSEAVDTYIRSFPLSVIRIM